MTNRISDFQGETSWYQLPPEQVIQALGTKQTGLTSSEAKARLEQYGYNELKVKKRSSFVRFLAQFHNALLYVLMVAALIAFLLGNFMDMWVIIGVVLATVVIGFIQEGMSIRDRQKAYMSDITYATAKEAGFDFYEIELYREP